MRFKQFISESRAKAISVEEAAAWIKKHSKVMMEEMRDWDTAHMLYRGKMGWRGGADIQIGDSRNSPRISANTTNEYTLLVDSSSAWKNFPKRSRSFICTSNYDYARDYGAVAMVFPSDSTVMACAGAKDFWLAFPLLRNLDMTSLKEVNDYINRMLDLSGQDSHQSNASVLRNRLSTITGDVISAEAPDSIFTKLTLSAMKKFKVNSIEQLIDKLLDPDENGAHTFSMNQWDNFHTANNEYWFSDEAVFVPVAMKDRLKEALGI